MLNRPRLLLVDDDTVTLQVMSRGLSAFAELRFAKNGEQALRAIAEERPDLAVIDAHMPGMGGLEILRTLRCMPEGMNLPVILITSDADESIETTAFDLGAQDFIRKPFDTSLLLERIRSLFRLSSLRPDREASAIASGFANARILLVDDDESALELLEGTLRPFGAELRAARDGVSALAIMKEWTPDLVLLDAEMPRLDGFAVCQAMQADPVLAQVPVTFISVHGNSATEAKGFAVGAADFVIKPFRPDVLRARVGNVLRLRREQEAALGATASYWAALGERRIEELVEVASDAIVCIDRQGIVRMANTAALRLFDVTADQCLGRPADLALPGWEGIKFLIGGEAAANERRRQGRATRSIRLPKRGAGSAIVEPVIFHQGPDDSRLTLVILRDVTDHLALEVQREQDRDAILSAAAQREFEIRLSTAQAAIGAMKPSVDFGPWASKALRAYSLELALSHAEEQAAASGGAALSVRSSSLRETTVIGNPERLADGLAEVLRWAARSSPDGAPVELSGVVGEPLILDLETPVARNDPKAPVPPELGEALLLLRMGGAVLDEDSAPGRSPKWNFCFRMHRPRLER